MLILGSDYAHETIEMYMENIVHSYVLFNGFV